MKRTIIAIVAAAGLMLGTAFPVSGLGQTQVTLSCTGGTSLTVVLDTGALTALTQAVQALIDYPAELSCTLLQVPAMRFGAVAMALADGAFITGGGRIQGDCGGGASFWINLAVNGHNQDGRLVGTVNGVVPDGQCVPAGSFKSVPICVAISGNRAYVTSRVTETTGSYFTQFGVVAGSYHRFSFDDNGNPSETATPDRVGLQPAADYPPCADGGNTPAPFKDLVNGNITIHQ